MNKYKAIYKRLYKAFGKQHWWPVISDNKEFEMMLGAILTQNTSWKNAEKAIINLNKKNLIDAKKINQISHEKLANLIRSAGYFNQKAIKLKNLCKYLEEIYKSNLTLLFKKEIRELREELLSIKGIGPETADSIILYAAQKPIFVVDAYTRRIMQRLGYCNEKTNYDELQSIFMENLPREVALFKEYHALLVRFGKEYCKKKAICNGCFLEILCKFGSI